MKWFKQKYSVCKECFVHFEPVTGYEAAWGHLCSVHRKPVMERDLRKRAIIEWASSNWERLEEMYKKETHVTNASYTASQQAGLEAMAKQQQAQGLGGLAQAAAFGLGGFLTGRG